MKNTGKTLKIRVGMTYLDYNAGNSEMGRCYPLKYTDVHHQYIDNIDLRTFLFCYFDYTAVIII